MTLARALRAEFLRLRTSPLVPLHAVCALAGGLACGAYFSISPAGPLFRADAYVQFLGALMPLMTGIVCGLAVDAEQEAGGLANLLAAPSRGRAIAAKAVALALMGALTLAAAMGIFAAVLAGMGKVALDPGTLALAVAGLAAGSIPCYLIALALALRFGRNAAIGVGAAGMLVAFFALGGLAHGLMTGTLTSAVGTVFGLVPCAWAARLGSLGVEAAIAAGTPALPQVMGQAILVGTLTAASTAVLGGALVLWFRRFEDRNHAE